MWDGVEYGMRWDEVGWTGSCSCTEWYHMWDEAEHGVGWGGMKGRIFKHPMRTCNGRFEPLSRAR